MIKKYSTNISYNSLVRIAHFDFAVNSILAIIWAVVISLQLVCLLNSSRDPK